MDALANDNNHDQHIEVLILSILGALVNIILFFGIEDEGIEEEDQMIEAELELVQLARHLHEVSRNLKPGRGHR